jgi:hypothetical protein
VIQLSSISAEVRHYVIIIVVFGLTGSITVLLSKLLLNDALGLEGTLWVGPWSYRFAYLALIPPSYSVTLIAVGTLFGKREFFARRVIRMWSRLLPFRR